MLLPDVWLTNYVVASRRCIVKINIGGRLARRPFYDVWEAIVALISTNVLPMQKY